ncbi:hypothetical protein NE865_03078 [Phthorimaea operculella]|nr:hypothetical protein NE865_03078 [Phthorimaea operculella]
MTRTILWCALALVTAAGSSGASGARYSDYADLKMPEYGSAIDYDGPRDSPPAPPSEPDAYHDHADDASMPMDYNEEDRDKPDKRSKEVSVSEDWQSSNKKHKKFVENENNDNYDSYNPEETNFKSNHRPSKHRSRLKPEHQEEEDLSEAHNKHVVRYGTSNKKYISGLESKGSIDGLEDGFEDDKRIDFEEDEIKRRKNHRETTLKKARRKPRDRFINSEPTPDEDDPIVNIRRRPAKDDLRPESKTHSRAHSVRRAQMRQGAGLEGKTGFGDRGYLPENRDDYVDYYDMKRVQNVKEKLMKEQLDDHPRETLHPHPMRSRPRLQDDDDDDHSDETALEGLRRLMMPKSNEADDKEEQDWNVQERRTGRTIPIPTSDEAATDEIRERPLVNPALRNVVSKTSRPDTTITSVELTTTTTSTTIASVRAKTTKLTNETAEIDVEEEEKETETSKSTTTEMSLAEKSRLSILKKAQRKEMLKESATKKPPVLLQVTDRRHTLVMVEPPTRLPPWRDTAEIVRDSPENLLRVKRLMRKKLVDNAKDVHELSENWDDLVCEYVDMSLIEQPSEAFNTLPNWILMLLTFIAIKLF